MELGGDNLQGGYVMFNCSRKEIENVIGVILGKNVQIKPIGNHHLERHLVYLVNDGNDILGVFKLYYKKDRWSREVGTLRIFEEEHIKAPRIIEYGKLSDGTEWIFMSHVDGQVFEKVKEEISEEELKHIYLEIGEELSKVHRIRTFKFFGPWNENCNPTKMNESFAVWFRHKSNRLIEETLKQHLPEKELQIKAGERINELSYLIDEVKEGSICNGDFGDRNILVKKVDEKWKLSAFIDFEHTFSYDRDSDLIGYYCKLADKDKKMAENFRIGYEKNMDINKDLYKKRELYDLYDGISTCSWAKVQAPDYYLEGVDLLKKYIK